MHMVLNGAKILCFRVLNLLFFPCLSRHYGYQVEERQRACLLIINVHVCKIFTHNIIFQSNFYGGSGVPELKQNC